jgi:hypothetical protein
MTSDVLADLRFNRVQIPVVQRDGRAVHEVLSRSLATGIVGAAETVGAQSA